nr:protein lifeguard 2 isoform X3 [Nothobranchius furzeri]
MSQTSSSTSEQHEPRPPPYSPPYYGEYSHSGVTHQVGNGNIAVVSPPGPYPNTTLPDGTVEFGEDSQVGPTQTPFVFESASDDGGFSDAVIRKGFVRKVYLTLMIQLLFTVGIICAFLYWNTLRSWVLRTSWFSYTMMSVVLVLAIFMSCCGSVRRRVPLNFIALGLFTLAEGLMLGSVAAYFDAEVVLWAVGATAFVSFSMSLFAMQSKRERFITVSVSAPLHLFSDTSGTSRSEPDSCGHYAGP